MCADSLSRVAMSLAWVRVPRLGVTTLGHGPSPRAAAVAVGVAATAAGAATGAKTNFGTDHSDPQSNLGTVIVSYDAQCRTIAAHSAGLWFNDVSAKRSAGSAIVKG